MQQHPSLTTAALVLVVLGLGGCVVPPENDPHNLPYVVWPADSPDVYRYSTNPYTSLTAPPFYDPGAGRR
jgi:hypothetical protein